MHRDVVLLVLSETKVSEIAGAPNFHGQSPASLADVTLYAADVLRLQERQQSDLSRSDVTKFRDVEVCLHAGHASDSLALAHTLHPQYRSVCKSGLVH